MAAHNAQHMLHGRQYPGYMDTIENYCHTEAREGQCDTKELTTISILCHTYKCLILNRIAPTIEHHLIKAGFRPGKSCTNQLLNLDQYIEDGYQEGMLTGTAFVDISAAYNTVNHRLLIQKLYNTINDSPLCFIESFRTCCRTGDSM